VKVEVIGQRGLLSDRLRPAPLEKIPEIYGNPSLRRRTHERVGPAFGTPAFS
jgi:hypothetical protein